MTRLRHDWYDNNDGKTMTGHTHNLKFVRKDEGMLGTIYNIHDPLNHYSSLVNHQEELNELLEMFFQLNQFTINHNITKG